jgi:antitoxin ParD1/3/4
MTVALAPSLAEFVHAKVSTGDYASESEVVRESLRILAARDAEWK